MLKTIIVYNSIHHKNTEKLLQLACNDLEVDLVDIKFAKDTDLRLYEVIGFASGIYHGNFHRSLFNYLEDCSQLPQKTFLIHTSGTGNAKYNSSFVEAVKTKGIDLIGSFHCKGFDTFGLFKYIGGIAKKHPNEKDVENLKDFLQGIIE
ncbi:flavodoxin [Chakrabartyella piscis]|uniref:flavodoxin n=1 Tax=Chakrabartyella piscis TaxID=2918914 RepID=UPI002958C383|nr:flavodoxin [Chakrabartyella piscis]